MLAEQEVSVSLGARGIATFALDADVLASEAPEQEYLVARAGGGAADGVSDAFGYLVEDTALALRPAREALAVSVEHVEGGARVTLAATSLVKDLVLQVDRVDRAARVDDGLVTLQAGESRTITVTGDVGGAAFDAFPLVSSVNDLVTG